MGIRSDIKATIKKIKADIRAYEKDVDKGSDDPWLLTECDVSQGRIEGLEMALRIIEEHMK